jgi:trehalose-6-phosphate synthase
LTPPTGFCNALLWPLLHYIPLSVDCLQRADEQFAAYTTANIAFARVLLQQYRAGDVVWVHDYQLMLLPALLRRARPNMKIGFFLHTPFPSSEIYRVLPARRELLIGVLSSDLIGMREMAAVVGDGEYNSGGEEHRLRCIAAS